MKIVFIAYLHGFGGAERQNVMLANAMAEQGHEVILISVCSDNNKYKLDHRIKYIFLPDRKKNVLRIITRYQDIKKTLSCIKPDLTVNFWFQSAYMTAMMQKSITGKVIYSERGDPGDKEYAGLLGLVRKLTLPRIDGFVFQSKGAQCYFDTKIQKRSMVIPNPVFIKKEDFPEVIERRKAVVNVGRLHPQKNQKLLINAFADIADQIPEYILEIYGEGKLRDELLKQINELGLEKRVYLKGTSKDIHRLIYDASVFVLSSDYEGLPNTLLEAMALGIPCVSTDCKPGGARDIITNGVDGIIVPAKDEEELADAIRNLLCNYGDALCKAKSAMVNMERFRPYEIYGKWNSFFESIIMS